jgi:hypothetical protein
MLTCRNHSRRSEADDAVLRALERVFRLRGDVERARGHANAKSDVEVALRAPKADLLEIGAQLSQATGAEVDVLSLDAPGVLLLD